MSIKRIYFALWAISLSIEIVFICRPISWIKSSKIFSLASFKWENFTDWWIHMDPLKIHCLCSFVKPNSRGWAIKDVTHISCTIDGKYLFWKNDVLLFWILIARFFHHKILEKKKQLECHLLTVTKCEEKQKYLQEILVKRNKINCFALAFDEDVFHHGDSRSVQ
jgi:hypothetical protein